MPSAVAHFTLDGDPVPDEVSENAGSTGGGIGTDASGYVDSTLRFDGEDGY